MKPESIEYQRPVLQGSRQRASMLASACVAISILLTVLSCNESDDVDLNSAGYHIAESEKLVIPAEVDVSGTGNIRIVTYYAKGVQIYNARQKAGSDPAVFEWVFASPSAILLNENNEQVGTHFAGPSWQLESGDRINGQQFTPAKTRSVDSNSIDWLLLMPKEGSTPTGIFEDVNYIQRIATTGGKAPTTPPASASETIGVEYTAVYRFSKGN